MLHGYWGGIVAPIRADTIHGTMIIILSCIAIPSVFRLGSVNGLEGIRTTLGVASTDQIQYLRLFDLLTIIPLCINAPLSSLAFPHLISVCAAGKTEWEGRMGFGYGALVKRFCTIGWCFLGLAWLTYLINADENTTVFIDEAQAMNSNAQHLLPTALSEQKVDVPAGLSSSRSPHAASCHLRDDSGHNPRVPAAGRPEEQDENLLPA